MTDGETKLADQRGKFAQVVRDGHKVPEVEWIPGRLLLSNRRLVLAGGEGKRTIPLQEVASIKSREDAANPLAAVSNYLSLQVEADVMLVSPDEHASFEAALYTAALEGGTVAVKHPALEGGVVQETAWEKGRLSPDFGDGSVALATADGQFVAVDLDDVGKVEESEATVLDERRPLVEVEHAVDGTAVETHVSGSRQVVTILADLLRKHERRHETDVELGEEEREVVMALYSGVSPFQIPEFVGLDVERVEEIYGDLVEAGVLTESRTRREVRLKARGRHVARDAMDAE